MIRPTLSLKSKKPLASTEVDPRQLNLTLSPQPGNDSVLVKVDAGKKPKKGATRKVAPPTVMARLSDALRCHCRVFIQLRSGAGYMGMPVHINDGWVTLAQASIHGTKNVAKVTEVEIQLGDCGQIAHMHSIGDGHTVFAIGVEGEVNHG